MIEKLEEFGIIVDPKNPFLLKLGDKLVWILKDNAILSIEDALSKYYSVFGLTGALKGLKSVYHNKSGYAFEFKVNDNTSEVDQLISFILNFDFFGGSCIVFLNDYCYEFDFNHPHLFDRVQIPEIKWKGKQTNNTAPF